MFNTRRLQMPDWFLAWFMVFLQFSTLGLIVLTGPIFNNDWWVWVLIAIGVMLGLWGIYTIRLGNFNITPLVKDNAVMVAKGPYRFIRHPMYTGLLIIGWALVLGHYTIYRLLFAVLLTVALVIKLHIEEGYLKKAFKPYAEYSRRTKKLIPFIW